MTATKTQTPAALLANNLEGLREMNDTVADAIRATPPRDDIAFIDTEQGPAIRLGARSLCSRRPLDEAERLTADIDLIENAVVVVTGFGAGWHVKALAERMGRGGIIIVLEPDLALVRAVFEQIDFSRSLHAANIIWISDPDDRGRLMRVMRGQEAILMQGVTFVEHPASRERLADAAARFSDVFRDYVTAAKTSVLTTLMRALHTTQNFLLNIDQYALGAGIADLADVAPGAPGIVVSAGPGLAQNIHVLRETRARERCAIVAVQTALKPLLEAGVKPHFITALDYHEISKRFYDGLTEDDVRGITLIADSKVHPNVIRSWPGRIRCCDAEFMNRLLGEHAPAHGHLDGGATVAHLAMFVARHLGCGPIALIGQDLGFPDGLYYAPGTAIHREWAPELNPFNTIAMMEWQRIVRMRHQLHKAEDIHGKSIYTDTQMLTYLQQFEGYFEQYRRDGLQIIDCTESGVRKQYTDTMRLQEMIETYATDPLPAFDQPSADLDRTRAAAVTRRIESIRTDGRRIRDVSRSTIKLLRQMLRDQDDAASMDRHFARLERLKKKVDRRSEAFLIINQINQVGLYRRLRADRRLHMETDLSPVERQRLELERDIDNVEWLIDAAGEMDKLLDEAVRTLRGEIIPVRRRTDAEVHRALGLITNTSVIGMCALPPDDVDADLLRETIDRLQASTCLKQIIIIGQSSQQTLMPALDDSTPPTVTFECIDGSPFGPEHEAILATRAWSPGSWRGGIAGTTIYDEVIAPQVMADILARHNGAAAFVVGHDWTQLRMTESGGGDDIIQRFCDSPDRLGLVFSQAAPGLGGIVVSARTMAQLADRNRAATVGGLLGYQPHVPQPDPIGNACCVQVPAEVRHTFERFTGDDAGQSLPQHIQLEICTTRSRDASGGVLHNYPTVPPDREPMPVDLAMRFFQSLPPGHHIALSLVGFGEPLLHPQFDEIIRAAHDVGIDDIHIRTTLDVDRVIIDRLLSARPTVVSVDLHAITPEVYTIMHGHDAFDRVFANLDHLVQNRRRFTPHVGGAAIALPWVVPHMRRCAETYEELEKFYDVWSRVLGTPVLEPPPLFEPRADWSPDTLIPAVTPNNVAWNQLTRRMTIYADGSVPVSEMDVRGEQTAGNIADTSATDLWSALLDARHERRAAHGEDCEALRLIRP